jgi:hypothetical protein
MVVKKAEYHAKSGDKHERLQLAAIGMESEFSVFVNDVHVKPEDVFGSPRSFIRGDLMHRQGTSYHLPTGGAVYFDTGVIEVATPVIEIERGCAARCGRSLWEGILFLRTELDAWEKRNHKTVRLEGFSTHYNISFELDHDEQGTTRTVKKLALLLTYILPIPVMLLAANRRSTGIGVRPRGDRIEITADFTPDASLMIATASLITGIVRSVMQWPSYELDMLRKKSIPVIECFTPMKHTSRKGWLAKDRCFPRSPFKANIDVDRWETVQGPMTLREIAQDIFDEFWHSIARISDPFTFRLIRGVLDGEAPSLLELPDRPEEYEDVGRLCTWDNLFPERALERSRYERVLIHAIAGDELAMNGDHYKPIGMRGWSKVIFKRLTDGSRHIFSIDYLLTHLKNWEAGLRGPVTHGLRSAG